MWPFNTPQDDTEQRLQDRIAELEDTTGELNSEITTLRGNKRELKDQLADQKGEYRRKEEDIAHMVRITQEKDSLELDRKALSLTRECDERVAEVKDKYRDEAESRLKGELERMGTMYSEILTRLPDVTAKLKGEL